MRFFSFPEIQTDVSTLVQPGTSPDNLVLRPASTYYLSKERYIETIAG